MQPLTEIDIRESFINASAEQLERMTLPGLHETVWEDREYLGWHDARSPRIGYIVHWLDGRAVGLVVRSTSSGMRPGIAAMCSLCHSTQPATQVRLFTAPTPGLDGSSMGSYICESLSCSHVLRLAPPHLTTPTELERRGGAMLERLGRFTRRLENA